MRCLQDNYVSQIIGTARTLGMEKKGGEARRKVDEMGVGTRLNAIKRKS